MVLTPMGCVFLVWVWGQPPAPEIMTVIVAMGRPPRAPFPPLLPFAKFLARWQCSELSPSPGHAFSARQSLLLLLCPPSHLSSPSSSEHWGSDPPALCQPYLEGDEFTFVCRKTLVRASGWGALLRAVGQGHSVPRGHPPSLPHRLSASSGESHLLPPMLRISCLEEPLPFRGPPDCTSPPLFKALCAI